MVARGYPLLFVLAACAVATGLACKRRPAATAKGVPFEDTFDRADLGPDWFASGGHWTIDNGAVYTSGAHNAPLFLKVDLPAEVVVEVDIMSETDAVDSKIELMTDGRTHQSGYIFILGGWRNQLSVIARLDEHGLDRQVRQPTGAVGKRWYRWRIEKTGGDLRWLIDGQPYMAFEDPKPLDGSGHNRLAFSNWQNQIRYDNLRIFPLGAAPPVTTRTATSP